MGRTREGEMWEVEVLELIGPQLKHWIHQHTQVGWNWPEVEKHGLTSTKEKGREGKIFQI